MAHEIRNMELYTGTLDNVIAFILTEMEDAAVGVEKAERRCTRQSTSALGKIEAIQANLLSRVAS
ncbi:hypothetical protein JKF63_03928 [Porcisia hertigi]|uniref:Uncharacterized protein n=1 Tax=Porcisia hertigi TaxID=2761500 RepID=A0A836LF36_9TRYP|nr:hypothetical protein JKF63_03928 [Porcisia hertigi]